MLADLQCIYFRACGFDMALLVERLVFAVGEVVLVGFTGKVYLQWSLQSLDPKRKLGGLGLEGVAVNVRMQKARLSSLSMSLCGPRERSNHNKVMFDCAKSRRGLRSVER